MLREVTKDLAREAWTALQGIAVLLAMFVVGLLMLFGVAWLIAAAARGPM